MDRTDSEKKLWKAVLASMELQFSEIIFKTWIKNTAARNLTENSLEIVFPHMNALNQADKFYRPIMQEHVNKIAKGNYTLLFKVGDTGEKNVEETKGTMFEQIKRDAAVTETKKTKNGLNPNYQLENYVMGNTNQLAYAVASAITQEPGTKYNPFFLYSGVGMGKTHLIQGIGNKIAENYPNFNIMYVTGENFTNELIETIQKGKSHGKYSSDIFRKKYRSADVLIMDDIQFIAGKDTTQEEFFHTFNELYMNQKQIIIASDRPPAEFKNLEERITSRFRSGMLADIQKPTVELRTAILRFKRDNDRDEVPNDVIDFIAERIDSNIRELEGAYIQVLSHAQAQGLSPTVESAKEALKGVVKDEPTKPVNINTVVKTVCTYYNVTQTELKGKKRSKSIVLPRQIAMNLIYNLTNTPYMDIGQILGGRDHTTIMHGVAKIDKELEESAMLRKEVAAIKQNLYQD